MIIAKLEKQSKKPAVLRREIVFPDEHGDKPIRDRQTERDAGGNR